MKIANQELEARIVKLEKERDEIKADVLKIAEVAGRCFRDERDAALSRLAASEARCKALLSMVEDLAHPERRTDCNDRNCGLCSTCRARAALDQRRPTEGSTIESVHVVSKPGAAVTETVYHLTPEADKQRRIHVELPHAPGKKL